MEIMPWPSIAFYSAFGIFVYFAILLGRLAGRVAPGQISVLAWPLCVYLMFDTLPG